MLLLDPPIEWPGPRLFLWLGLALLGAFIGTLIWFRGLVSRARTADARQLELTVAALEAEEARLAALRARATADPAALADYARELRAIIQELETVAPDRVRGLQRRGSDVSAEIERLSEALEWVRTREGKGGERGGV